MSRELQISNGFVLFGTIHVLTLLVSAIGVVGLYWWGRALRDSSFTRVSAWIIAITLVGLEFAKTWHGLTEMGQPWQELLPLHLCRIGSYICALMLVVQSYRIFEVAYFWGIGGSLAAMLTPDLVFDFPHPIFLGFFFGHALVFGSVLFVMGAYEFRPQLRSIGFAAIVTAIYMGVVAFINIALDTNYLYLSHKPETATLYDYLGPWPWYIGSVWLIGIAVSFILYLPFAWRPSRGADSAD